MVGTKELAEGSLDEEEGSVEDSGGDPPFCVLVIGECWMDGLGEDLSNVAGAVRETGQ